MLFIMRLIWISLSLGTLLWASVASDGQADKRSMQRGRATMRVYQEGKEKEQPGQEQESEDQQSQARPTAGATAAPFPHSIDLLSKSHREQWEASSYGGQGEMSVTKDIITFGFGYPITGVTYRGQLPRDDYQIEYSAKRTDGTDFFGTLTFPVGDDHCSFILGGWGGTLVGLSCLDGLDASSNETKKILDLKDGQWYRVKVRVDYPLIQCWIEDKLVVDVDASDRKIHVRSDVLPSTPLGFCTFETRAEIKDIQLSYHRIEDSD